MLSRRAWLVLSIMVSLGVHAFLIAVAPQVTLVRAVHSPQEVMRVFQVQIREDIPPLEPIEDDTAPMDEPQPAASPASIEDLLNRELERLTPDDPLYDQPVEIPLLAERIAHEPIEREHELIIDDEIFNTADTRVIEIPQEVARQDIQVSRRAVRPSPNRVLPEGVMPTFRTTVDDLIDEVLLFDAPPSEIRFEDIDAPAALDEAGEMELIAELEAPMRTEIAEVILPPEEVLTESPVVEAISAETTTQFIDALVDVQLETYVPPGESLGYFRLRIIPKAGETIDVLPKDVTFVVDASLSIMQQKLNLTARGVRDAIAALRPQDRFNVVLFRDTPNAFQPDLVYATEANKQAAYQFLANIESRGRTDLYQALRPVIETPPRPGVPGIVMVVSDGRPTAGLQDARDIINRLTEYNAHKNTIYSYAGGSTVNRYLLDLLAFRNKGNSGATSRWQDLNTAVPQFFSQLQDPILVNLNADFGRVDKQNVYPREVPDFYRGQAVTVYGRFDPSNDRDFYMHLRGQAGEAEKDVVFSKRWSEASNGNANIARGWAFNKIYHLIGEISRRGESPELLAEINALSRRYNIETSYSQ